MYKKNHGSRFFLFIIAFILITSFPKSGYGKAKLNVDLIGGCLSSGSVNIVEVLDQYAFCGTSNGLLIIDISDINNPKRVVFLEIGDVNDIEFFYMDGGIGIYAALTGENSLKLFEVSDPKKPTYVGEFGTIEGASGIAIQGHYAFVAAGDNGIAIFDISDPTDPKYTGGYDTPGRASGIAIQCQYAFVADMYEGLAIIDISDPTDPVYTGGYETAGTAYSIATQDNYAFVADWENGLIIIDISDPTGPIYAGGYDTFGNAQDVAISGYFAFVADRHNGLVIIDIADPADPIYAGGYNTPGDARDVFIHGNYTFVADGENGLVIIDNADPTEPIYAGGFDTTSFIQDIIICGNYAFVLDGLKGLIILDIADPKAPIFVARFDTPGRAYSMAISGHYAFVADGENGLVIIDIADPKNPIYAGGYDTAGDAIDIAIQDRYAFIIEKDNGLLIIDISDPSNPIYTGSCDIPGRICAFAIIGDYLFIFNDYNDVVIIDISDPSSPTFVGWHENIGCLQDIVIYDNYIFGADGYNGLVIMDISDPSNPQIVGKYDTPGNAYDIAIDGEYAFIADGYNGLVIIDISDPTAPTYAGGYDTPGLARRIAIQGNYAFVVDGWSCVLIFKIIKDLPTQGNLILCPSGPSSGQNPLWPPSHALANMAYTTFTNLNYPSNFIYYITPNPYQDINANGIFDAFVVDDSSPTTLDIHYAITEWALNRLNNGPLYLYLTGLGAEDRFQVMPGQILYSYDPNTPDYSLKHHLDIFQEGTGRDIICLFEFASSGTFCNALFDTNTLPYSRTIITCADEGATYLDITGLQSFTSHLLTLFQDANITDPGLFEETGISYFLRVKLLQGLFSQARKNFWSQGKPFNTQPPQMVTAQGPHTLCSITLTADPLSSTIPDSNQLTITAPDQAIFLTATGHYLDDIGDDMGDNNRLSPNQIHYHSSDPSILQVTPEGEVFPNLNTTYNGKAYILATIIDPNFTQAQDHYSNFTQSPGLNPDLRYFDPDLPCSDPNHPCLGGVTGRIPISVDIPTWQEKENLPLAIIVAGEKKRQDYLWEEIHTISQHVYHTLFSRKFSRTRIKYLTHLQEELLLDLDPLNDYDTDLDGDGDNTNDIDGVPSRETLKKAIEWVKEKGTNSLTLILVSHSAGQDGIYLGPPENDPNSILTPLLLDHWLDGLQAENPNLKITIIIESSFSGCFIEPLWGENRIIITSAAHDELSYIYTRGLVSFTYHLFTVLHTGADLASAFDRAVYFIRAIDQFLYQNQEVPHEPRQSPQLYNRYLASRTFLGGDFIIYQDQPVITSVEILPDPNQIPIHQEVTIKAEVFDFEGVADVWAIIDPVHSPPVFSGNLENPIMNPPEIPLELTYNGIYEGTYAGFTYPGPYTLLVFAKDIKGNISIPFHQYLNVTGGFQANALLIAGWEKNNYKFSNLLSFAQRVLQRKRFAQIKTLTEPTLEEIEDALNTFDPAHTDQLFIYLVGPSEWDANNRISFAINPYETMDPDTLDYLLDPFSSSTQIILIDTPGAEEFFKDAPNRIYIGSTSAGQNAYFDQEGLLSFSCFFFTRIYYGTNVYQAYNYSSWAMQNFSTQTPTLFDGHNGQLAKATYPGSPFVIPTGFQITIPQDRDVWGHEILWAEVSNPDPNTKVWALVKEPGKGLGELKEVSFSWVAESRYEALYLFLNPGTYEVYTYAQDPNGLVIYDKTTYVKTVTDVTYLLNLPKGWSMVSLPVMPHNPALSEVFPDAVVVYEYQKEAGYVRVADEETLDAGEGYWILSNDEQNYTLIGQPILEHTLTLSEDGWRMLGGCTCPAQVSADLGHIVVIYCYVQGIGYKRIASSECIEPGCGYWILINNIMDQAGLKVGCVE